jgi:hypothetical protein
MRGGASFAVRPPAEPGDEEEDVQLLFLTNVEKVGEWRVRG